MSNKMVLLFLICTLFFFAAYGGTQVTPDKLLDDITSTVINDMFNILTNKDVMTIDAALRSSTAEVQPQLREFAKLKGMTIEQAAKEVTKLVANDKRLLQALSKRDSNGGKVAPRSSSMYLDYVMSLVYKGLSSS